MAIVGAQNVSSSSSAPFPYVIFLSFRGKDSGKTFTDHLYNALISEGLSTFRDNNAIERGEDIKSQLQKAILLCKSAIVVISKGYADSPWCLDELVLILKCRKTTGLIVVPVFYDVEPSHVRHQRKSFSVAMALHEKRCNSETDDKKRERRMDRLAGWRKALTEVANLSGMVWKNEADGYETEFIKDVVSLINKLSCNNVAPDQDSDTKYIEDIAVDNGGQTKPSNSNYECNACFVVNTKGLLKTKKLKPLQKGYAQITRDSSVLKHIKLLFRH